jgi:hypothetical protein
LSASALSCLTKKRKRKRKRKRQLTTVQLNQQSKSDEERLRDIAGQVAMLGFHYDKEWVITILENIRRILIAGGYASDVDVM